MMSEHVQKLCLHFVRLLFVVFFFAFAVFDFAAHEYSALPPSPTTAICFVSSCAAALTALYVRVKSALLIA